MFTPIADEIGRFAKERDWEKYHHPKNLILNIFVELSELTELLIGKNDLSFNDLLLDKTKMEGIKDELGDLMINLVHFAKILSIEINQCEIANIKNSPSPSQVLHMLQATIRYAAEPITWITEEESLNFVAPDDMPQILREAISIALYFSQRLSLNPIDTALIKMEKIKKKFPVDALPKDVTDLHRKKTKNRKPTF